LETVEDRIEEADLRIGEKQDRLDQLADERETALQYQQFRDELEEYRGFLKASELEEKRETLAGVEEDIDDDETELEELRAELDARQGKLTRLEEDLADLLNHEIETKGEDEQIEIRSEIEEVKGEISRLEDKIERPPRSAPRRPRPNVATRSFRSIAKKRRSKSSNPRSARRKSRRPP